MMMDWLTDLTPFFSDRCWQFVMVASKAPLGASTVGESKELAGFEAHWADFDQYGCLVAAAGGRILEGEVDRHQGLRWRQRAGLRRMDRIVSIDRRKPGSLRDAQGALRAGPGRVVRVGIQRGEARHEVKRTHRLIGGYALATPGIVPWPLKNHGCFARHNVNFVPTPALMHRGAMNGRNVHVATGCDAATDTLGEVGAGFKVTAPPESLEPAL